MPRKAKDKENEIQEKTATKKRDTARRAPTNVAKTSTAAKKKAPAKKTTTKKATTKKTATKETSTKKVSTKKAVVEETATKKASIKKAPAKKSTTSKKSSLEAEKNIKTTSAKKTTKKETVPTEKKSTTRRATTKATTAATKKATATNKTTTKKNNGTVASTERRGRRSLQSITASDVLEKANKTPTKKETATKKTTTKKKTTSRHVSTKKNKVEENLEYYDLPYRYNETTVKILAQTPKKLFIYWDISDDDRKNYVEKFGTEFFNNTVPVLLVHNDSQNYTFEVEINDFANCWYLDINDAKCEYTIELGRRSKLKSYSIPNNYIYVTSSNVIESPNDHILFEKQAKTVYFRNVKTNATHSKDIANISFIRNMGKIYNIYDAYKKLYGKMYSDEDMLNNPTSIFK